MPGLSIIVCCYNASERLPDTLTHLSNLVVNASVELELIVVDNNSQDQTVNVASENWQSLGTPFPIKFVAEKKPGLSFARRAGVLAAKFDLCVFCDDDNWFSPDYAATAIEIMNDHPEVGVLGGDSLPQFETAPPAWFYDYATSYAIGSQADFEGHQIRKYTLWGGGMVFRSSLLKKIYLSEVESLITDRKGSNLTSGGDNEICAWYIFAGYRMYYSPRLKMTHLMPRARFTEDYRRRFLHTPDITVWPVYQAYLQLFHQLRSPKNNGARKYIVSLIKAAAVLTVNPMHALKVRSICYAISNLEREGK